MTGIQYRSEIDGLRAIAVLAVVLYHAGFGLRAGSVGVDVFFVISGYLITSLLYAEVCATGRIDLTAFYARRFRRIFPALVLVVISTVIASSCLLSPYDEIRQAATSGATSLLFAANFFFQAHTGGYFDPSAERMPLLHLWSLGVEEQFYLLWPLLLIVLVRWWRASIIVAVAVCGLASLSFAELLLFIDPNAAFYQMPARFWELALGGLITFRPSQQLINGQIPAAVGVLTILASTAIPIGHFPGLGALPAVLGAGILLYAIHSATQLGWTGVLLRSRPMRFFGLISYSLYLWHWPLLALERATHQGVIPVSTRLALCVIAVMLSFVTFRWVEQPTRRPDPKTTARKIVAVGMLASIAMAYTLFTLGDFLNRVPPPQDLASRTSRDMPDNRFQCHYRGDESLQVFPNPGCIRPEGKPVGVAIWGDSHALAWTPFAWASAQRVGVAATSYTRDACAPALDYDNGKRFLEAKRCREFNALVITRLDGIDTLILSALWPDGATRPDFYQKFEATIRRVSARVKKIIVLGPTPYMRDSVPLCIESHNLSACEITRTEYDVVSNGIRVLLRGLAAKYANVEYVELTDFFCDAKTCPPLKNGYGLYWDSNHVASTAAREFSKEYFTHTSRESVSERITPR